MKSAFKVDKNIYIYIYFFAVGRNTVFFAAVGRRFGGWEGGGIEVPTVSKNRANLETVGTIRRQP